MCEQRIGVLDRYDGFLEHAYPKLLAGLSKLAPGPEYVSGTNLGWLE